MSKQTFILAHDVARKGAASAVMNAPDGYCVEIKPRTRSLDQNSMLWPLLTDIANQVEWYGKKLDKDEWKEVLTAGLKRNKVVPGIDGGFVVVGASTSKMDKKTFSELIELILAFGAQQNVKFSSNM